MNEVWSHFSIDPTNDTVKPRWNPSLPPLGTYVEVHFDEDGGYDSGIVEDHFEDGTGFVMNDSNVFAAETSWTSLDD